jgi:hypothetical protein
MLIKNANRWDFIEKFMQRFELCRFLLLVLKSFINNTLFGLLLSPKEYWTRKWKMLFSLLIENVYAWNDFVLSVNYYITTHVNLYVICASQTNVTYFTKFQQSIYYTWLHTFYRFPFMLVIYDFRDGYFRIFK